MLHSEPTMSDAAVELIDCLLRAFLGATQGVSRVDLTLRGTSGGRPFRLSIVAPARPPAQDTLSSSDPPEVLAADKLTCPIVGSEAGQVGTLRILWSGSRPLSADADAPVVLAAAERLAAQIAAVQELCALATPITEDQPRSVSVELSACLA